MAANGPVTTADRLAAVAVTCGPNSHATWAAAGPAAPATSTTSALETSPIDTLLRLQQASQEEAVAGHGHHPTLMKNG